MAKISENCVNCAIGALFDISGYMGISKTIFDCNHSNKEMVRTKSCFFNLKKLVAILCVLIINVSNYYAVKRTYEAIKNGSLLFDLLLTNFDGMLYLIATITIVHSISQNEKINNMLMFYDSVLKDFKAGTSWHLLSKDDVVYFRIRTYIYLIGTIIFFAGSAICVFCTNLEPIWNTIERIGLLLSIFSCFMLINIALLFLRLVYYSNANYKRFLKIELENLGKDSILPPHENPDCRIVTPPRTNVKQLLKVYTDTFIEYIKIFKVFNKICDPIVLILILFITLFCIISVFLIIVCIENNTPITIKFLSVQFGMQFVIFATGWCIVRFAKINTQNTEELTLLRKFPLSKLNNSEKLQFDCYLYIVKRYQITLRASDVVSVDISLFASMLSTILTYVLVAVQFEFL